MATWDSADLLARVKKLARRPAVDQQMSDQDWYDRLTEAQLDLFRTLATHVPESQYGASETLTTSDGGVTYQLQGYPYGLVELRARASGRLLVPGNEFDPAADFVIEGQTIRFPDGKPQTFAGGPVARYAKAPTVIDASTEPTLLPDHARVGIVYKGAELWAAQGGTRNPDFFRRLYRVFLWGDPESPGDVGLVGALKYQYFLAGAAAIPGGETSYWWRNIDDGSGYTPLY